MSEHLIAAATKLLTPLKDYSHQCHRASILLVKSGVLPAPCRVARGICTGVGSQHSWVILGDDCYAKDAKILDPTLWSYDDSVEGIWLGSARDGRHTPHGSGMIWDWGRPPSANAKPITLEPRKPFSDSAQLFLDMMGPIDEDGWRMLCHAPVEGWPAGEIFSAICDTFDWGRAVIPIDIRGMITDENPSGLYLKEAS